MKITFISDTHTKHQDLNQDLDKIQGDLLIHAGDSMNSGYDPNDVMLFASWFNRLNNYKHKVFIAGNHDRLFENEPELTGDLVTAYGPDLVYLQDKLFEVDGVKIYGSPWSPYFYNWAWNLPRNGWELELKWKDIPDDTDILVCHTMPWGHLDTTDNINVGCELLRVRIDEIKPKIFVGGHIHSGYGYKFDGHTHFFNAAVLNNSYKYTNKPISVDWDPITNTVEFL